VMTATRHILGPYYLLGYRASMVGRLCCCSVFASRTVIRARCLYLILFLVYRSLGLKREPMLVFLVSFTTTALKSANHRKSLHRISNCNMVPPT
jgi:hypothetical protein